MSVVDGANVDLSISLGSPNVYRSIFCASSITHIFWRTMKDQHVKAIVSTGHPLKDTHCPQSRCQGLPGDTGTQPSVSCAYLIPFTNVVKPKSTLTYSG